MSSLRQFLLSLLATTVSIVLTFGTAAVIDHNKKKAAKKGIEMMVINDLDQTIESLQKVDSGLRECSHLQMKLAAHPEQFDSLRFTFAAALNWMYVETPETIEKVFSTSIETFNTVDNVNFVNLISAFYLDRRKYKTMVFDKMKADIENKRIVHSLDSLMSISFPEFVYVNGCFLLEMKDYRDKCMKMTGISEDDMIEFKHQNVSIVNPEKEALNTELYGEFDSCQTVIEQAKAKFKH